jgi:hypothetical protein
MSNHETDPVAFAEARLDEDEAAARAAASVAGPHWHDDHYYPDDEARHPTTMILSAAGSPLADTLHRDDEEMAPFIARYDPARALREVEAGRRILARHQPDNYGCQYCADGGHNIIGGGWGCADLADLLYRWADHPDYRIVTGEETADG